MGHNIPDLKKAEDAAKAKAQAEVAEQIASAHAHWRQQFFAGYRQITPGPFNDAELAAVTKAIGTDKHVSFKKVEGSRTDRSEGNADACNYVLDIFKGATKDELDHAKAVLAAEAGARARRAEARQAGF